ncbi:MAG TPA: hypothetical protein VGL53_06370 [Bryobacteraceae bacterium]|jgi:hypothetical protein
MWTPPPNVTEHQGSPLPPDADFFVDPPPEIGPIRTAHTSLKQGVKPKSAIVRLAIALACGAAMEVLLMVIDKETGGVDPASGFFSHAFRSVEDLQTAVYLAPVALLTALIAWLVIRFNHSCNYVGDLGCADFTCKRRSTRITKRVVFQFKSAHSITSSATEHYKNTAYINTTFAFNWYASPQAKPVFWLKGSHTSRSAAPPVDDWYHFCRSAETAWYYFIAPQIDAELAEKGRVRFYANGGWMALGPGFIEITDRNGGVSRFNAGEIATASSVNHILQLFRPGVFFNPLDFSKREGVYRYDLTSHNLPLFKLLFQRCLGIHL